MPAATPVYETTADDTPVYDKTPAVADEPVAARPLDRIRQIGRIDLDDIPCAEAPHPYIHRALRQLQLQDAVDFTAIAFRWFAFSQRFEMQHPFTLFCGL